MRQCVVNRKIRKAHQLKPLFGVYPSLTIHLHQAATTQHKDHSNSTQLPCVVMPVENTDPSGSGQLVLEELGLIFAMNPGDIIIFPSALLTHWNLHLSEGVIRTSLTAWGSGNLCSWADEGCRPRGRVDPRPRRDPSEILSVYS